MTHRKPIVVFRCDASTSIGTGHVRRCLSLAQALRQLGKRCVFAIRHTDVDAAAPIRSEHFETFTLQPIRKTHQFVPIAGDPVHAAWLGTSQVRDAEDTILALSQAHLPNIEWIVADHYAIDAQWHQLIRSALNCQIAVIDDLGDRPLAADLLIDHNHAIDHRKKYAGKLAPEIRLLTGPKFALISPAYTKMPKHAPPEVVRSIGIFMGGIDAPGWSAFALRACEAAGFRGPVEIATTSACPHIAELQSVSALRHGTTVTLDQPDLTSFYLRHDLHIGAGGGATWERCCLGVPTIALETADNQSHVLAPLDSLGILEIAAPTKTADRHSLVMVLRRLLTDFAHRQALSLRSKELVDGRGASRCAEAMMLLSHPHPRR